MSNKASSGGMGVCSILLVIFICAKVFEIAPVKDWSWWAVFIPLWIPLGLVVALFLFAGVCYVVAAVLDK